MSSTYRQFVIEYPDSSQMLVEVWGQGEAAYISERTNPDGVWGLAAEARVISERVVETIK